MCYLTVCLFTQLYINLKLVGHQYLPTSVTAKSGLSPPEMMLGCHKDATNGSYRYYI